VSAPAPSRTPWRSLLASADSIAGLAALARALGFGEPAPVDAATRQALGIPGELREVHVAEGAGATRALMAIAGESRGAREPAHRLATRLSARAPHLLWLACLTVPDRRQVNLAAWSSQRVPPRIAALMVDRDDVLASDVETLAALGATTSGNDLLRHARWLEILGREAISRRFYAALERLVMGLADDAPSELPVEDRREIALLNVSRLLFLAFLETKGWLDADRDFLARVFDDCMSRGGAFHRRVLEPLFFGTLNTRLRQRAPAARAFGRIPFLNGGLFHRSPLERRARSAVFADQAWGEVYDELLLRYRFTAHEESAEWSETAVDPEMLGRAFESLMASRERRDSGAYFTPYSLVERGTEAALDALLEAEAFPDLERRQWLSGEGGALDAATAARLRSLLGGVRLLDPACGSGAFLIHALDRLSKLWQVAGDPADVHGIRRRVLTQSIFGVDVNPMAVWLCELRLWLAVVLDDTTADPLRVTPLPNLDHNIRCGDALVGGDFSGAGAAGRDTLQRLRLRYVRATGPRKRSLARALERGERTSLRVWLEGQLEQLTAQRRALVQVARGRDLFGARRGALAAERDALRSLRVRVREVRARIRALERGGAVPFAFAAHFPEVARRGGFDVVIGNPPWVRLHRIPPAARERLRREFGVFRHAAWDAGAREARAGSGFGAQVDVAALFVERGLSLARPGGVLSLLVPAKLWRSLAGGGVRRLLMEHASLRVLEDWSDAPPAFDASTYPSLVAACRNDGGGGGEALVRVHRGRLSIGWRSVPCALPLDDTPGAPWLTLPPDARAAFERLARDGVPLSRSGLGHPTLGVKCGLNEAFLVRQVTSAGRMVQVSAGGRVGEVEAACLRPALRGETLRPWRREDSAERLVFTCDEAGRPLPQLPPGVRAWLVPGRSRLARRADARGMKAWWALFRTASSVNDRPRVVWADLGRAPQALVLPAGDRTVALNSCYVLRARDLTDALALAALLNGPLAAAWLGALAEPARGGYRRFMAWTMARLPVPDDWARAREILVPLGARGCQGAAPSRAELLEAALDAYRCRLRSMAPLLSWMAR
jgi:hypothetical protein